jgi:hypothetical protein
MESRDTPNIHFVAAQYHGFAPKQTGRLVPVLRLRLGHVRG